MIILNSLFDFNSLQGIKLFFFFSLGKRCCVTKIPSNISRSGAESCNASSVKPLIFAVISMHVYSSWHMKSLGIIWVCRQWNKPILDLNLAVKSLCWVNLTQNESTQMKATFGKPEKMGTHLQGEWLAYWCPFKNHLGPPSPTHTESSPFCSSNVYL